VQIVPAVQQGLHELDRLGAATRVGVLLDEPEAAHQEGVLVTGQAVLALGAVAQQQAVLGAQVLLDPGDGREHARIVGGEEAGAGIWSREASTSVLP
jgi:hypothetical protein